MGGTGDWGLLQVPLEDRDFVSRYKTVTAYQNLQGNVQKCCDGPNMYRFDHHLTAQSTKGNCQIQLNKLFEDHEKPPAKTLQRVFPDF